MSRDPRYLPPGWSVEVTTRTICGFYLLPATSHFARVMVGILARAQEKYPVEIHAAVAATSHAEHLPLRSPSFSVVSVICPVSIPPASGTLPVRR